MKGLGTCTCRWAPAPPPPAAIPRASGTRRSRSTKATAVPYPVTSDHPNAKAVRAGRTSRSCAGRGGATVRARTTLQSGRIEVVLPRCFDAGATSRWRRRPGQALRLERPGRERGARHARADLGERRFAVRGGIVAEGRETAVVGRPEPVERNVLRRFQDSVPYLFGRLDARVDRIDHADEYPLAGLDVLLHEAQRLAAVGLTRALDVEVRHLQLEERGQEVCVVHVGAVRRVPIAARTGVDADPLPLFGGEALEHLVVQVDERLEQPLRWIELDREPALREIELHDVGALRQTPADVRLRLAQQITEERFARVSPNPVLGIHQTEGRGRNDRLLDGHVGERPRVRDIPIGVRLIAERPGSQPGELPHVPVRERDRDAVGCEVREPVDRVRGEARFRLLPIGDHGGLGRLEAPDGVADRRVLEASELVAREATGGELLHPRDELRGSGDAANGFSGDGHGARLAAAVAMSMTLSPNPWTRVQDDETSSGRHTVSRDAGCETPASRAVSVLSPPPPARSP